MIKMVDCLKKKPDNEWVTASDLAKEISSNFKAVNKNLSILVNTGFVISKTVPIVNGKMTVYHIKKE